MKSGYLTMEVVGSRAAANTLAESPCNQDYFIRKGHLQVILGKVYDHLSLSFLSAVCEIDLLKKQDFRILASCCAILFSLCKLSEHQHHICQEVLDPLLDLNHSFSAMVNNREIEVSLLYSAMVNLSLNIFCSKKNGN